MLMFKFKLMHYCTYTLKKTATGLLFGKVKNVNKL